MSGKPTCANREDMMLCQSEAYLARFKADGEVIDNRPPFITLAALSGDLAGEGSKA